MWWRNLELCGGRPPNWSHRGTATRVADRGTKRRKQNDQLTEDRERKSGRTAGHCRRNPCRGLLSVLEDEKRLSPARTCAIARSAFGSLAENIKEVFWITDTAKNAMLYVSPAYDAIWGQSHKALYADPRTVAGGDPSYDRGRVAMAAVGAKQLVVAPMMRNIASRDRMGPCAGFAIAFFPVRRELRRSVSARRSGGGHYRTQKSSKRSTPRAQRVEAIGMPASGMAHNDLNNILRAHPDVRALLRLGLSAEKTERTLEGRSRRARQRGADLVRQLLDLRTRRRRRPPRVIQPKLLVMEMLKIARQTLSEEYLNVENVSPETVCRSWATRRRLHPGVAQLERELHAGCHAGKGGTLAIAH